MAIYLAILGFSQAEKGLVLSFVFSTPYDTWLTVGDNEGKTPSVRPGTQQMITAMPDLAQPLILWVKALSTHPTTCYPPILVPKWVLLTLNCPPNPSLAVYPIKDP